MSLRIAQGDVGRGPAGVGGPPPLACPVGVEVTFEGTSGFEAGHGHLVGRQAEPHGDGRPGAGLRARGDRDGIRRLDPLVPMLTRTFPRIEILMWGAMDERSFIHSVNESVDLSEVGASRSRRRCSSGTWAGVSGSGC